MTLSQAGTGLARIHRPVTGAKAVVPPLASNARRGRHAHSQRPWRPDLPPRPREELVPGADAGPSRALKTRRLVVDTRRACTGARAVGRYWVRDVRKGAICYRQLRCIALQYL